MTARFVPNSMSLPPPRPTDLDLLDGARPVGWVRGFAVGFRGFANENEAAGAAWAAHRTLARRLARRHGGRAALIDIEPLSFGQDGDRLVILAGGKPIATLLPPGVGSLSGPDSFGFEIEVPVPLDELSMRSLAHRTYHTLRKSGVRWAMWDERRVNRRRVPPRRQPAWAPTRRSGDSAPAPIVFISKLVFAALAIVLGTAVIATAPRTVTLPIAAVLAAGVLASGFMVLVARWCAGLGSTRDGQRRSARATVANVQERARSRDDDPSDESMRERGWVALGVVSMAVLGLAIVVPDELAVAFAAIGLAGLVVFRLTAAWAGWTPGRTTRMKSSVPAQSQSGTPPRLASS